MIRLKFGRLSGSYAQHWDINEYNLGGQLGGNGRRSPFSSFNITSLFLTPWKGFTPSMSISQMQTPDIIHIKIRNKIASHIFYLPNIQTSLAVVNLLKFIDSGDIHLMGRATVGVE